ncbi:MAG TPA: protein kinase [Polyangiaceae bacterium]
MGAASQPRVVGRYVIHDKLASGGMATVHFGRLVGAVGFARTVAIKRLHPHLSEDVEFRSTIIDEARLAARIHHPNVVATLDVVSVEGELLIVMEYVGGESLSRLVKAEAAKGRAIPVPIANAILIGALHGLHAAHEAKSERGEPLGIVHRDVSPQNVLVGVDGVARIIDFGVAKAIGRLQTTREGVVKGKMAYMAPEQLAGHDVTRQADVYAAAVVLWEVLARRALFKADNDGALFAKVVGGAKEPPSRYAENLPPGLDEIVMKGLAVDPRERFATAEEMAEALLRVVTPAFPPQIGRWVEEVAREPLAARGAVLADIESQTDARATIPEKTSAPATEEPTALSQASSLSIETVTPGSEPVRRSRTPRVVATAGVIALLGAAAVVVMNRRAPTATSDDVGASAATSGVAVPSSSASAMPPAVPTPSASAPAEPPSASATVSAPSASSSAHPTPARPGPHRRPAAPSPAVDPASFR